MIPLARALLDAGNEVRWAVAEQACDLLTKKGFDATPTGPAEVPMPMPPPEVIALPVRDRPNFMFAKIFGGPRVEQMLTDLLPLVEEWKPTLLVCEQAEFAGPIAAAAAGIPNATHGFGQLLPEVRLARAAAEVAPVWEANGLEPRPYAGTYDHLFIDTYPPSLQTPASGHIGETQLIRPATPLESADPEVPIVYITLGTISNQDLGLFSAATEAARDLPVRVVVTLGPGNDPAALGEQPPNVRVAEFIPQEELLPECAAVISHVGSGTFLAALAAGVPQVFIPLAADQFLNAEAGESGGLGLALWPGEASVPRIREALVAVLDDSEMRARVSRVRDEIAAMPPPGAVAEELARRFG